MLTSPGYYLLVYTVIICVAILAVLLWLYSRTDDCQRKESTWQTARLRQ